MLLDHGILMTFTNPAKWKVGKWSPRKLTEFEKKS